MDPVTAIGLVSSILTFIEFSAKLISGAAEAYSSPSGLTADDQSAETVATEMQNFLRNLHPPDDSNLASNDKAICMLATECQLICEEILTLLERNRPKSRGSRRAALLAGLKSRWREVERRRLEERLRDCRFQLTLQLQHLTNSGIKAQLDALIESADGNTEQLVKIAGQLSSLNKNVAISSLSPESQAQIESLLRFPEQAIDSIAHQLILKALSFAEKNDRYDTVYDAHFGTFEWIFNNSPTSDQGPDADSPPSYLPLSREEDGIAKTDARNRLFDWLKSGEGIFHISGKLGSGKSTLMKYLCENSATKSMLTTWAGHRQLVFASFFFWRPGSNLQRSLTGLVYSILHDVLDSCRELIPIILPEAWKTVRLGLLMALFTKAVHIHDKEIKAGFARLISNPGLYDRYCFCFFIDGLDEYEGTYQEDHKSLVDRLRSWTTAAPGNIKLCVSSREYNVFMNAFMESHRIRLHQLTSADMRRYTSDKLGHLGAADKVAITKAIVDNANGIFLWVVLVTKRIRELIEDGSNTKDLFRELDALPRELDDLFTHLLNSLSDSDRKMAYRVFLMLLFLKEKYPMEQASIHLLSLSFLDEYERDPQFVLRADSSPHELERADLESRFKLTAKRIQGYSRGFVEVVHRECKLEYDFVPVVEFTHRSVPEFLAKQKRIDDMHSVVTGFDALDAISHLRLAEAFANPASCVYQESHGDIFPFLLSLRFKNGRDTTSYSFPEAMSRAVMRYLSKGFFPVRNNLYGKYSAVGYRSGRDGRFNHRVAYCRRLEAFPDAFAGNPQLSIYAEAFEGNHGYVRWKLLRNDTDNPKINLEILLYFLLMCKYDGNEDEMKETMELIIQRGVAPLMLSDVSWLEIHTVDETNPGVELGVSMTVWQHLLLDCYGFAGVVDKRFRLEQLGVFLEKFLEHGADPHFQISIDWDGNASLEGVLDIQQWLDNGITGAELGDDVWEVRENLLGAIAHSFRFELVLGKEKRKVIVRLDKDGLGVLMPYRVKAGSLVEYLSLYKACFRNWDRILELTERNLGLFDGGLEDVTGKEVKREGIIVEEEQESVYIGTEEATVDLIDNNTGSQERKNMSISKFRGPVLAVLVIFGLLLAIFVQLMMARAIL